jgi:hypothetical protein
MVYPMFAAPWSAPVAYGEGGHGGGDKVMLNDLFGEPGVDPLRRAADHRAGAMSILTGVAANISMQRQAPVNINEFAVTRE